MKVLQLGKFYPIRGGVEKVMLDLTEGLGREGVKCDMLCACADGDETLSAGDNASIICVKSVAKLAATMISPAMILKLRRICNDYDIIHVHHPDPMAGLALLLSGYKGKVILHWHSDIIKQKFFLQFYKPVQTWLLRRASLVVGTSPAYIEGSEYLRKYTDKTVCLPIGIRKMEPDEDTVASIRKDYQGKKIVLSLGRMVEYKGFRYLIEAASLLPDNYVVLIGGDGPMRKELEGYAQETGAAGKVRFLGRVSDELLPSLFGASDLFVLSSIFKTEAFGIVQIEAMSCGKPVVATNIPGSGVSWVNADGVSGLNVPVKDGAAIAEAILKISNETAAYDKFSRESARRYASLFTLDGMIDGCLKIYRQVH